MALAYALLAVTSPVVAQVSQAARLQLQADVASLPAHDVLRGSEGRYITRTQADLRWQLRVDAGNFRAESDIELTAMSGPDVLREAGRVGAGNDDRAFDLAVDRGTGPRVVADRLLVGYRREGFALSLGRQALTWGNGLVFAPMDLLSPFAPTATDRDFKRGNDLVLAQWQLPAGGELQAVHVLRRDTDGDVRQRAASSGLRWQHAFGSTDWSLLLARHRDEDVLGVGLALPVADAVLRADWVLVRLDNGDRAHSLIVNADRSFVLGGRNVYAFVELYRNGFGQSRNPRSLQALSPALRDRLQRGETFTFGRWYAAVGGSLEWHSLLQQQTLVLGNLGDGSALFQSSLRHEPDDARRLELTVGWSLGGRGDEFGTMPIRSETGALPSPTTGGGWHVAARHAWYW